MKLSKFTKSLICGFLISIIAFNMSALLLPWLTPKEGFEGQKTLLLLHMDGCPHCVTLMPIWEKFVSTNKTSILTKDVEKSKDPNNLSEKYDVKGFPTILLLDGKGNKSDTYEGDRTVEGLINYVKKKE